MARFSTNVNFNFVEDSIDEVSQRFTGEQVSLTLTGGSMRTSGVYLGQQC